VPTWTMAPAVAAYQALPGVSFLVAITFVAEVGDLRRFATPQQLMPFLGLVASERTTGDRVRRGLHYEDRQSSSRTGARGGSVDLPIFCTGRRDLAGRLKDLALSIRSIAYAQRCAPATVGSLPMGRRPLLRQRRLAIHGRTLLAGCVGHGDIPFTPLNPITVLSLRCVVEFEIAHQPAPRGRMNA
jgi:hypothetical protein